ncbi:MAG: hypothetical protein A2Y65_11335 [Deltaproteobacteria bacterium RBG_13_52_11]|nr:MAG: hypothetical protein A2Y65_11335 [Deltaproteobacteria bacterium RBG_13_52_11]
MAIMPIGKSTAEGREQKNRKLSRECNESEQDCRARQPIDKPRLGHRLHPGAGERNELPAEEEPVIPMLECAEVRDNLGPGDACLPRAF